MERTPVGRGRYLITLSKEERSELNDIRKATMAMALEILEAGSSDQSGSSELKFCKARLANGLVDDVMDGNLSIGTAARIIKSIKNVQP